MALTDDARAERVDIVQLASQLSQLQEVNHLAFAVLHQTLRAALQPATSSKRRSGDDVPPAGQIERHSTVTFAHTSFRTMVEDDERILRFVIHDVRTGQNARHVKLEALVGDMKSLVAVAPVKAFQLAQLPLTDAELLPVALRRRGE